MNMKSLRKFLLACGLGSAVLVQAACDPTAVNTGGSVYYDSVLWNDYYYGGHRPPPPPGAKPPRPEHPIARPPGNRPPGARPPAARPPIHRPPGGGRPRPR